MLKAPTPKLVVVVAVVVVVGKLQGIEDFSSAAEREREREREGGRERESGGRLRIVFGEKSLSLVD